MRITRNRVSNIAIICFITFSLTPLRGQSVDSLLKQAHILGNYSNLTCTIELEIQSEKGIKNREVEILSKKSPPEDFSILAQVKKPAFLKSMKFLSVSEKNRKTQYLKTSRGIRRLAETDRNESLFNSDLTIEDFSDIKSELFHAQMDENNDLYIIILNPRKKVWYSSKKIFLKKKNNQITKIEYYKGKSLVKWLRVESWTENSEIRPETCLVKNLEKNTSTVMVIKNYDSGSTIKKSVFSRNRL